MDGRLGVGYVLVCEVRTVTDTPPSREALAQCGVARGLVYILQQCLSGAANGTHGGDMALTAE